MICGAFLWHSVFITGSETKKVEKVEKVDKESDDDSDMDILDVDLSIDVNKMEPTQVINYLPSYPNKLEF